MKSSGYTPPRRTVCWAELHDMTDPANVGTRVDQQGKTNRWCRPCERARHSRWAKEKRARKRALEQQKQQLEWKGPHYRSASAWRAHRDKLGIAGRRVGGFIAYQITPVEQAALQHLADGLTHQETEAALYLTSGGTRTVLHRARLKYGVATNAGAVAQGLKRGLLTPDRTTAKLLRRNHLTRMHTRSVIRLVKGERPQYRHGTKPLEVLLDTLCAWSEPHAVSVLWGAGLITSRHVPQTRNRYRGDREEWHHRRKESTAMNRQHALAS